MTRRWHWLTLLLPLLLWAQAAHAQVVVTFYSHEFGDRFPHAFITLTGAVEATGAPVNVNYGFTAASITPGILFGSVKGEIQTSKPEYVADSDPHFSIELTDRQYGEVLALVEKWRTKPQNSYNLNRANCIHFVAEMAQLLGLRTNADSDFFKKPRSFLQEVRSLNSGLKLARSGRSR